jgi:hypothetical protein
MKNTGGETHQVIHDQNIRRGVPVESISLVDRLPEYCARRLLQPEAGLFCEIVKVCRSF